MALPYAVSYKKYEYLGGKYHRIDDKSIGRVFVAVGFQNFGTAVIGRVAATGQIGNCRNDYNRLAGFVPAELTAFTDFFMNRFAAK